MPAPRPNPLQWLYYQYGGRLPDRYKDWVLHDTTSRWWLPRAFVRTLCQAVPVIVVLLVVFALFGVPWYFAVACVVLGLVVSIYYALSYSSESVDSRLSRYGYPSNYASTFRQEQYEKTHAADAERYNEMWRPDNEK
jgi:hypothetical protein